MSSELIIGLRVPSHAQSSVLAADYMNKAADALQAAAEREAGFREAHRQLGNVTAENERLTKERERLALAICGGEDAPGWANAQTVEYLEQAVKESRGAHTYDLERADRLATQVDELVKANIDVVASLAASISLLKRTPQGRLAAASDKMFKQMLVDYEASLERARALLSRIKGERG